jgi:hypothetical protein
VIAEGATLDGRQGEALNGHMIRVNGHFILKRSTVIGPVLLRRASIAGMVDLTESRLRDRRRIALDMEEASVGGALRMVSIKSFGAVRLSRIKVGDVISLGGCRIYGTDAAALDLYSCNVANDIRFDPPARGRAFCTHSRIRGPVIIQGGAILGSVMFSSIAIVNRNRSTLNAHRAEVSGALLFHIDFLSKGRIDLSQANVGSLYDTEFCWFRWGGLRLEGFTYENLSPLSVETRLDWLLLWRRTTAYTPDTWLSWQPYEQLINCFKRHGREADAREISIHKQRAIRRYNRNPLVRAAYLLYDFSMRYGYRPQRALVFAPFLIGICTATLLLGGRELMVPSEPKAREMWVEKNALPDGYPSLNSLAYAIDTFVPILSLQQRDAWRPDDRAQCVGWPEACGLLLRVFLWLHTGFGWIITTLAVAGFTGLIRRD